MTKPVVLNCFKLKLVLRTIRILINKKKVRKIMLMKVSEFLKSVLECLHSICKHHKKWLFFPFKDHLDAGDAFMMHKYKLINFH